MNCDIESIIDQRSIEATIQNNPIESLIDERPIKSSINGAIVHIYQSEIDNTFETISKNLRAYPATLNYISGVLTSIVYTLPSGIITKTFNYTSGLLTSIVLSGNTPENIDLTKTLGYTGGNLTSITYS